MSLRRYSTAARNVAANTAGVRHPVVVDKLYWGDAAAGPGVMSSMNTEFWRKNFCAIQKKLVKPFLSFLRWRPYAAAFRERFLAEAGGGDGGGGVGRCKLTLA